MSLIHFFRKEGKLSRVRVFNDNENNLIGLRPDDEGYKISIINRCARMKCTPLSKIINGEFYPSWSKEHGMLIISY